MEKSNLELLGKVAILEKALEKAAIVHVNTVYDNACEDHSIRVLAYMERWKKEAELDLRK